MVTAHRLHIYALGAAVLFAAMVGLSCPRVTAGWQWPVLSLDPQAVQDAAAVAEFNTRVAAYVDLHRRLEGAVPTLQVSQNVQVVRAAMDALAARIQDARRDAKQGEVFIPAIRSFFVRCIAGCLPPDQMEAILAEREEGDRATTPAVRVNARWPEGTPYNLVPPQMIAALPQLPPELQYRIIGRSLVLWDHHADLIVDVLPNAFPT